MSNLRYILVAYAITLGALALYGIHLWTRLRSVESVLTAQRTDERMHYGHR
jgi:hypothetical protein